jgi:hypothetical protein
MSYSARSDPFQELFANLHNILPIGLALAAWAAATWSKLKKKSSTAAAPAADDAERTRRIQEDVRRKIAERRSRYTEEDNEPAVPPPVAAARPAMGEGWRGLLERERGPQPLDPFGGPNRRAVKAAPAPIPVQVRTASPNDSEILERQRWLAAAQTRDLKADGPRFAADAAAAPLVAPAPVVSPWLQELREPGSVRRALVLREILGAPVGLR